MTNGYDTDQTRLMSQEYQDRFGVGIYPLSNRYTCSDFACVFFAELLTATNTLIGGHVMGKIHKSLVIIDKLLPINIIPNYTGLVMSLGSAVSGIEVEAVSLTPSERVETALELWGCPQ